MGLSISKNIDREFHTVLTLWSTRSESSTAQVPRGACLGRPRRPDRGVTTYHDAHYHGVQEVLPRGRLSFPGPTLQFAYDGGDGEIDISDIVIWIRVNV
jgi:hypothetical protein